MSWARSGGVAPRVEALADRPADVVRPPELLEDPDGARRDVDLAAVDAVAGAGRVGVVQVVPRLAERRDREPPHVAGPVTALELVLADRMADRVDRPRDVVQ